ncbi:hypothetical protein [Brevundimonas bacteroides]|uniref:hypothetical protein n=1 Tax=Brevundimonas bacteroides TaxID=74311 RepID=UPI000A9E4A0E|nr:hypothetical protein [Brevundimonas bacteroides]
MCVKSMLCALALSLATPALAIAQQTPAPTDLRLGLVGRWTGALGYRDYQTDRLFEIPVQTTISTPGDGATLIRQSLFDDGPENPVWITTVSLDDPAASTVMEASYRAGRQPELSTDRVTVSAYNGPTSWTLVYSQTGEDNDEPADIRVTETRSGGDLMSIKEVRPVGAGEDAWRFRNQTRLRRVGD